MRMPIPLSMILCVLLSPGPSAAQSPDPGTEAQREAGKVLFDKYCSQCHGADGDGQGFAAAYLQPRPRDFTSGQFKLRTTPSGALPTDDDLRKAIRQGMPYTTMIGWPDFTDDEVANIIHYIKRFSPNFEDPEYYDDPIAIPAAPAYTTESAALGREIYVHLECYSCHGDAGRADGVSAPELVDDGEFPIRPADLTKRWTFRGGPAREDIYRTFSTGMNGTPMPSFADSLTDAERWQLADYVYSLGESDAPNYSDRLIALRVHDPIDLAESDALFEQAESARFPLVGQIMEPGRAFHPSAGDIEVRAIYNDREAAFLLTWNDSTADDSGNNNPALKAPNFEAQIKALEQAEASSDFEEGAFFDEFDDSQEDGADEDFFGDAATSDRKDAPEEDFFGDTAETGENESGDDDFFGEAEEGGADDFFAGEDGEEGESAAVQESGFSDAVAIQFPSKLSESIRLPYFIFGDLENSVDIWFADLAGQEAQRFIGRGSASITPGDAEDLEMTARYEDGEWKVIFKQKLRSDSGISFEEGKWFPIGFSVWDGWREERGNQRALTSWFYVYIEPGETASPFFPMVRVVLLVLGLEIAVIALVRRKHGAAAAAP